jgi:hypothetical protein
VPNGFRSTARSGTGSLAFAEVICKVTAIAPARAGSDHSETRIPQNPTYVSPCQISCVEVRISSFLLVTSTSPFSRGNLHVRIARWPNPHWSKPLMFLGENKFLLAKSPCLILFVDSKNPCLHTFASSLKQKQCLKYPQILKPFLFGAKQVPSGNLT